MKLLASKQNLAKPGPIHVFSMWHTQRTRENVFIFYKDIFTQPDPIWMCLEFFSDGYVIEFDSKFGKVLDFTNNLTQLLN